MFKYESRPVNEIVGSPICIIIVYHSPSRANSALENVSSVAKMLSLCQNVNDCISA